MADVSHELGSLRFVVDSPLSSKVAMFNNQVNQHKQSQLLNPFSSVDGRVSPKPQFSKEEYGKPLAGSLTEMRGQKASIHVMREMLELCQIIDSEGHNVKDEPTMRVIPFGELFNIYNYISDKVVGILLRARKHKLVQFEGEMLFQRRDDDVPIFLLKPIKEIREQLEQKIEEIKRASSPAPQATSVLLDRNGLSVPRSSCSPSPSPTPSTRASRAVTPSIPTSPSPEILINQIKKEADVNESEKTQNAKSMNTETGPVKKEELQQTSQQPVEKTEPSVATEPEAKNAAAELPPSPRITGYSEPVGQEKSDLTEKPNFESVESLKSESVELRKSESVDPPISEPSKQPLSGHLEQTKFVEPSQNTVQNSDPAQDAQSPKILKPASEVTIEVSSEITDPVAQEPEHITKPVTEADMELATKSVVEPIKNPVTEGQPIENSTSTELIQMQDASRKEKNYSDISQTPSAIAEVTAEQIPPVTAENSSPPSSVTIETESEKMAI